MPSRFSTNFFTNLYQKAKQWLGFGKNPEEEIEPLIQDPEEIVDQEYQVNPEDPINVPFDQGPPELEDARRVTDPENVELQLQDMVVTPPEERDLPPIDGVDPQDAPDAVVEREPEVEKEIPHFPEGKAGFSLKIDYAMDKGMTLSVDYVGPYARFGPDYEINPLEWSLGKHGRFVWVKDVNDAGAAVKMFYLDRFRAINLNG